MDFAWTETQESLHESVHRFASGPLTELLGASARGTKAGGPHGNEALKRIWRACGDVGLLGANIPASHGGAGLSALTTAHTMEAFGRGCRDGGLVFAVAAHGFACATPIAEFASLEERARVLPRLCRGDWIGANAITEPEAGSDLAAMRARAVATPDGYRLRGEKSFVTNGPNADLYLVYASTHPPSGYLGISAFLVDRDSPGLHVGPAFEKIGLATAATCPIYLDDCPVPAARLVGKEGEGLRIFNHSMAWERSCLFAGYLGAMERQIEETVAFANERRQFRKAIGRNQAVSHRIAEMKLRLEAARLLLYRACWAIDQNEPAAMHVALAKLAISEGAIQSGLDAIRIRGGAGCVLDEGVADGLLDAVPSAIFSGTSEMQRSIIASELGL